MRQTKILNLLRSCFLAFSLLETLFIFTACTDSSDHYRPNRWVHAQKANLRTDPLLLTSVIEILDQNTPLQVLTKSKQKVRIASQSDYWYFVRLTNGIEGWIYGAALTDRALKVRENLEVKKEKGSKTKIVKIKTKAMKKSKKSADLNSEEKEKPSTKPAKGKAIHIETGAKKTKTENEGE